MYASYVIVGDEYTDKPAQLVLRTA